MFFEIQIFRESVIVITQSQTLFALVNQQKHLFHTQHETPETIIEYLRISYISMHSPSGNNKYYNLVCLFILWVEILVVRLIQR